MTIQVILPALGMSQDTGKIVQWLKAEGQQVAQGEPLAEIETDKATVELEAPASGILSRVSAAPGDEIPVGQVIAMILASEEAAAQDIQSPTPPQSEQRPPLAASPLASRIAAEHNVDVSQIQATGRRVQKADVLSYLQSQEKASTAKTPARLPMASPKARRLAHEQGIDLTAIHGTGPEGAVVAVDIAAIPASPPTGLPVPQTGFPQGISLPSTGYPQGISLPWTPLPDASLANGANESVPGNIWRIMAERTTQSWTTTPHFYLMREVNASRLIDWRKQILKRSTENVTYTDLLVKIVAAALRSHPRLNASWNEGKITHHSEIHVGLAVAIEDGLVVPVLHRTDTLPLREIAHQRKELVAKAQTGKLRPEDLSNGTFTISNLGMYQVDAFNAIINAPQAAILAVGRIADRVVAINGQPAVQPMMVLTLSCDHRAVDGTRGAQFLDTLATLIEEPLGLLD